MSEEPRPFVLVVWIMIVLAVVAVVGLRVGLGSGMARAYEERTNMRATVEDATSPSGERVVEWVEWRSVSPADFARAVQKNAAQDSVRLSIANTVGLWIAALLTLAIFSFLYRDNPAYRLAEAIVIGVSAAYWGVIGVWDSIVPKLCGALAHGWTTSHILPNLPAPTLQSQIGMGIALVLGVLLLLRLVPSVGRISVWAMAFIVGITAGAKIISHVESDLLAQTVATMQPLVQPDASGLWTTATLWASLPNVLIAVGVLCCLTYFFFSIEHKGVVGGAARVGIMYLMITFGAAFGFTVMGRVALLSQRVEFLLDDWLWVIDPLERRMVDSVSWIVGVGGIS